ncbi:hypothetical protein ABFS83_10G029700 [Erythranthe nasuta]
MRIAAEVSKAMRNRIIPSISLIKLPPLPPPEAVAPPSIRQFSSSMSNSTHSPVAVEMIKYATSLAREQKTEESYARGLLVLEQCESTQSDDNTKGLVELARSTLMFERGLLESAIERLGKIQELSLSSIAIKVAASEALGGIYLEHYQDAASAVADLALQIIGSIRLEIGNGGGFDILETRIKALKGLIELIRGNLDSACSIFDEVQGHRFFIGNAALSYGEYLHVMRNFSTAKELYKKVIKEMSENKGFSDPNNIGACNMAAEEVEIAAACALGQLEAHMGNFNDAEEILTAALKKTEERFGAHHPKVGVVLTCIALMYKLKATVERSSSLLIQEGLFRRAIELLKAPPLDVDGVASENVYRKDIIAFARGGYGETLCVQKSRKAEGERLKEWAENGWGNRCMSLGEALELSETSTRVPVIDTRICRVLL